MNFSFFFHFLIKNFTRLVACGVSFETPGRIRDNIMNESKKKKKKIGEDKGKGRNRPEGRGS